MAGLTDCGIAITRSATSKTFVHLVVTQAHERPDLDVLGSGDPAQALLRVPQDHVQERTERQTAQVAGRLDLHVGRLEVDREQVGPKHELDAVFLELGLNLIQKRLQVEGVEVANIDALVHLAFEDGAEPAEAGRGILAERVGPVLLDAAGR